MRCCNEFSRRALVARAAEGLPAIEPGMPLPAGTGLDRRSFLARSAGVALAVYGASRIPLPVLEEGVAQAAASDRILVSVFLPGGADSLSILSPQGDPLYRKLRPKLALRGGTEFAEDERLRWHPAAAPLATLHTEGKLTVLPAVGYTNADQSHFTSRHFWEVGATDANLRTGWLGRYLDRAGDTENPLQGLSLNDQLSPALAAARVPVAVLHGAGEYGFWSPGVWGEVEERMLEGIASLAAARTSSDPALRSAAGVAAQADRLRRQLVPFAAATENGFGGTVTYPSTEDEFPKRLAGLGAMIAAGLPLRCVALDAPGDYDTHGDQPTGLTEGLELTADSLLAFQRDLEARGLADRVLTLVWSEFGRRAEENGSLGTDHGAAGVAFLIGSRVRGRMIGEFPGLAKLDEDGNLRATSDYRSLYASLLEEWLGADAGAVLPGGDRYPRFKLLR